MKTVSARLAALLPAAPIVLRVALGGILAYHGFKKFQGGISGVEGFFASMDVPLPELTAPLTAGLEVALGVALIVGFATRLSAVVLTAVLVGAVVFVKADLGVIAPPGAMPGSELDIALIAGLVALALLGPGRFSVDAAAGIEPDRSVVAV